MILLNEPVLRSQHLKRALDTIEASISGMTEEQMTWSPDKRWSASLIVEHLALALLVTVKAGRLILRQQRPDVRRPTWKERLIVMTIVEMGWFPFRAKAPRMVTPLGTDPEEVKHMVRESAVAMDQILTDCETKFGSGSRIMVHPILGPLTTRQWRKFHWAHARHHVKQILLLRRELGV